MSIIFWYSVSLSTDRFIERAFLLPPASLKRSRRRWIYSDFSRFRAYNMASMWEGRYLSEGSFRDRMDFAIAILRYWVTPTLMFLHPPTTIFLPCCFSEGLWVLPISLPVVIMILCPLGTSTPFRTLPAKGVGGFLGCQHITKRGRLWDSTTNLRWLSLSSFYMRRWLLRSLAFQVPDLPKLISDISPSLWFAMRPFLPLIWDHPTIGGGHLFSQLAYNWRVFLYPLLQFVLPVSVFLFNSLIGFYPTLRFLSFVPLW